MKLNLIKDHENGECINPHLFTKNECVKLPHITNQMTLF